MPETKNNKNIMYVYNVTEYKEKRRWTLIGLAFVNKDGSLNVKLNQLPLDGKLHIRKLKDYDEAEPIVK